jgi:Lon protease-like protein
VNAVFNDMSPLPLFVLPMVLMPGEIQELRIFEPRYRQMLDDCLLDEKNFGVVMNDPFTPTNAWDGPRTHGCEAEILHHETKGSNHFVQIIGRRRFTVNDVNSPALPPFSAPMFEEIIEDDGILPDVQELLEMIPDEVGHSKLYISAGVEFHSIESDITTEQQSILKGIMNHVLTQIGTVLRIEDDLLEMWVTERVNRTIDQDSDSIYAVAGLVLSTLEAKQQILACPTIDEAIEELVHHVAMAQGEEE